MKTSGGHPSKQIEDTHVPLGPCKAPKGTDTDVISTKGFKGHFCAYPLAAAAAVRAVAEGAIDDVGRGLLAVLFFLGGGTARDHDERSRYLVSGKGQPEAIQSQHRTVRRWREG
mgnify:CR=1 FL=1